MPIPQISIQLTHLETAGLLRLSQTQPEVAYFFRHALVQDAAYAVLLQADRKELHRKAGESLERLYPDRLDELAPQLGRHFTLAGDAARALPYLTAAGDAAMRAYANSEAIAHYTLALQAAGGIATTDQLIHLYSRRGRALELNSQYPAALENYEQMEQSGLARTDRAIELAALMGQATLRTTANPVSDTAAGQALLARALTLAQESGDEAIQAKIHWNLMLLNVMSGGDTAERLTHGESALRLARRLDLRELTAFIQHDLWYAYGAIGRYHHALLALDEAAHLWRELGNLGMLAATLSRHTLSALYLGHLEQAIAYADEAFALAQASSDIESQALSRFHVGWAYLHLGQPQKAFNAMQDSLVIGEAIHNVTVLTNSRADLGYFYALFGRIQLGLTTAQAAVTSAETILPFTLPMALPALSRVHLLNGDVSQAEATLARCPPYAGIKHQLRFFPDAWTLFGLAEIELALAQGRAEPAVHLANRLIDDLQADGLRLFLAEAYYLQSKGLLALGRTQESYDALQAARQAAEAIGSRWALWPVLAALADHEAKQGDPAAAHLLRRQAHKIIMSIAGQLGSAEEQAYFLQQPAIHQIITLFQEVQ